MRFVVPFILLSIALPLLSADTSLFAKNNLAAWCLVPFDAKKRGPEERAAMLEKLGFTHFVYDYRAEHVPTFDAEMEALKKHHIELNGWWFPGTLNDEAKLILGVIKRHGMTKCDLWITGSGEPTKSPEAQAARVVQETVRIKPIALEAAKLGVRVGLYNHGSWFGEPENMVAIAEALKRDGVTNVGIVYNLHHGHEHLARFTGALRLMLPHLICVNLNGMIAGGDAKGEKILPIGQGDLDLKLLKDILASGYRGPIGILNHTNEDAEGRLQDNLTGLQWLTAQLDGKDAGPKPTPITWKAVVPSAKSKAQANGQTVEGKAEYRALPITVECRAKLDNANGFNILVACDPKISALHWELYTHAGNGDLSVFLPGRGGDFKSKANVCDGTWHDLAAIIEEDRVRLFVDGNQVFDAPVKPKEGLAHPGDLAFGQLSEGGLGCDGEIGTVRISKGVREISAGAKLTQDEATIGFWNLPGLAKQQHVAEFIYDKAPLKQEQWSQSKEFVNRDRVYDFYAKEARHFMKQSPAPELLPEYPGLDGGTFGHWGNQDDNLWRDGRWNDTDLGSVMSGVFRGDGLTIPKGVCVQLGEHGELAACFDPLTLSFPIVWRGGFVGFDPSRHGFMGGVKMKGDVVEKSNAQAPTKSFVYHGFYRNGPRVIFTYSIDGENFLDSAWSENGKFKALRDQAAVHPMRDFCKGGPTQWPQWIETKGKLGTAKPYALDTLTLPVTNPWKTLFFVSGHDFFSNGDAAICTMTGEVWICRGIDESLQHLRWKRFATGLHQPLGLKIVDDKICVTCRDQITRLHDLNGDDEADFYECLTNAQITSPGGHDFITGCERDAEGRFYFASGNQGLCRVKPGEAVEVVATGFRNPNGMGLDTDGTLTTNAQEGDWTPASQVCQIKPGAFYGYKGPKNGQTVEPPLIWLPRGVDNSCGGQCFVHSEKWGPLDGQLIHFSSGAAGHFLVLREKIGALWQGAAVPLVGDFLSGAQNGRINPKDGQMYVDGLFGWGTYAPADGCFQRVRYTGSAAYLPVKLETHQNGVLITFSDPLDKKIAGDARQHFAQCWNYRYSGAYGSPEFSVRRAGMRGHDALGINSAHVLDGGKKLFLEIPQLVPANTVHLHLTLAADVEREVFITAHKLGAEFTDFPNYKPVAKTWAPSAIASFDLPPPMKPNPWAKGKPGRAITLEAALGLQYAQKELRVKAGERVSLTFKNPDVVPHNFVLVKPEKLNAVGDLANKLITDPQGLARHYVPDSPDVLLHTDMVNAGGSFTIHFDAPNQAGKYPYLCTFPGHWVVMNGVLIVE